ncbi:hypothetical protein, partial [Phyllobacterium endophyticum]|uniref:hypothetical protein n=1 Tax=Phyllobacterium endophyticum TaxID=1149773 RepID=UPI001AEE1CEA
SKPRVYGASASAVASAAVQRTGTGLVRAGIVPPVIPDLAGGKPAASGEELHNSDNDGLPPRNQT